MTLYCTHCGAPGGYWITRRHDGQGWAVLSDEAGWITNEGHPIDWRATPYHKPGVSQVRDGVCDHCRIHTAEMPHNRQLTLWELHS